MKINGDQILDRMHDRRVVVSRWCRDRDIDRGTFYKLMRGEFAMRRDAHECRRIIQELKEDGYLPDEPEAVSH